jgi:hypothetical protein
MGVVAAGVAPGGRCVSRLQLGLLAEHIAPELKWVRRGRRKLVAVAELERWLKENGALTLDETNGRNA